MLEKIEELIVQVSKGMDCYKGKMSQENVIHLLKSLVYDAKECESKINHLTEENERLKPLSEIGAMVEKWNSYPHKKVIFKTYLGEHGEMVESINTAMAKYKESQEGKQNG